MEEKESTLELSGFSESGATCSEQRIPSPINKLIVSGELFVQTMDGLSRRSAGNRESAAIWAGKVVRDTDWVAECVFFYHDLCDDKAGPLFLELSENAKFRLYKDLSEKNLRLIAVLHTHPKSWVDLSPTDQRNQLSSRIGFWSIVLPYYGRKPWRLIRMGIHVLTGDGWYRLKKEEIAQRIILET